MSYPAVRQWLIERASLEPSLLEGSGFDAIIAERLTSRGCAGEPDYISLLESSPDEVEHLTAGIAVPETWFFRYPQSFRLLVEHLERRRASGSSPLRMLSIGCATGEEPCSMAMAALHAGWPSDSIVIEALDRNRSALARARAGRYGAASFRTEIPVWAAGHFGRSGGDIVVDPAIRAPVRFISADITQSGSVPPGPPRDVVFCRNLLIYLAEPARKSILESICAALAPGGLLFVGHAEPLLWSTPLLHLCAAPHAFALQRGAADRPTETFRPADRSRPATAESPAPRRAPVRTALPASAAQPPDPTLDDARDLADAGRAKESETLVRAILARRGPSAAALELLGTIRMASNDLPEAKRCFEQALYLEPSRTVSLLQLTFISEQGGDPRRAETLWNRVRRLAAPGQKETR
jgi:chemotaxis protein methyltransferase WspC